MRLTGVNGVKEVGALSLLLDVGVNQQRVGLGVDVLHHDLETVEASSLRDLNLSAEALDKVLVDDTVRGGEECEDVRYEASLGIIQTVVPIHEVMS